MTSDKIKIDEVSSVMVYLNYHINKNYKKKITKPTQCVSIKGEIVLMSIEEGIIH